MKKLNQNNAGRNNISGIEAQIWAAMSLFLQYVADKNFEYIQFEGPGLEDFDLVFSDGHKIICESKKYTIGYSEVRRILERILSHGKLSPNDTILIVSTKIQSTIIGEFENYKYFPDVVKKKLKSSKHKFQNKQIKLIPQIRFWEVSRNINEEIVISLISGLLKIWAPRRRVEEIKDSVTLQNAFHGSAHGRKLARVEFLNDLDLKKAEILEDSRYEKEKEMAEESIKGLHELISSGLAMKLKTPDVSILTTDPTKFHFVVSQLRNQKGLNLRNGDSLWHATSVSFMASILFDIFKQNLHTRDNIEYALEFCKDTLKNGYDYFRNEFVKVDMAELCDAISEKTQKYDKDIFGIITQLFKPSLLSYFYSERRFKRADDTWEREEVSSRLFKIYQRSRDSELKEKIVNYVVSNFNLTQDDTKYWHYSPPSIYQIIKDYVMVNPKERILWFTDVCVRQFNAYASRFSSRLKFNGWEMMGSGISQMGNDFSISDRCFVTQILTPAIMAIKDKPWDFVFDKCISYKIEEVNDQKPDFLNRASIQLLFKEYKNGKHETKAFEVLSDFIKMRKGIPWKADLIYQFVRDDGELSEIKKWKLITVSLERYAGLPVNVFVQQVVSNLAAESTNIEIKQNAIRVIKSWSNNPDYDQRTITESFGIVDNVNKLLAKVDTRNEGVEIFTEFINSKSFISNDDSWRIWDVSKTLTDILIREPRKGLELLNKMSSSVNLSPNQQNLIASSLNNIPESEVDTISIFYIKFVKPLFRSLGNNIENIATKFNARYSRELFVQFAEKLAKIGYYPEALEIVKIFIDDTDPIIGNYPDDEKGTFNEHEKIKLGEDTFTIRTVRGWCAWVLQKLVIPRDFKQIGLTRKIIRDSLPLISRLINDDNYYVRVQGAVPLLELARNRNSTLPEDRNERFVSIETAEKIKEMAFSMLRNPQNHALPAVMKQIVRVFSYMRSLTQVEAFELLTVLLKNNYPDKNIKNRKGGDTYLADIISEASPLYIFYALFRKQSFKYWPQGWEKLGKFDDKPFLRLLIKLINHKDEGVRNTIAWQFARLPDEIRKTPIDKQIVKYDKAVKLSVYYLYMMTKTYNHNVFEDIYRFVKEYIDDEFKSCFELWSACIDTESDFFRSDHSSVMLTEMSWWPYFYNSEILIKILDNLGPKEFLRWVEKLLDYPPQISVINDFDVVVKNLVKIKGEDNKVELILSKLIQRDPKYYTYKKAWANNKS